MTRGLVLLNGWGMTQAVWQPLVDALGRDRSACMIDPHRLVGSGPRVEDYAAAASMCAPRRCDVVGWSLGAQIALQWAHDRSVQIERMVLMAATPCFVARDDWAAGMARGVFEEFAGAVHRHANAALLRFALLQARGDANMSAVARILRGAVCDATHDAQRELDAGLECLRQTDLRALAGHVKQPTLLVHGAHDALIPLAATESLRDSLPQARLTVMSDAGHAPHVSEPAAVAALIAEFLDEQ